MVKVLIATGGTGGHILPAISIGKELEKLGCQTVYVGNRNGMEINIFEDYKLEYRLINVQKMYRRLTLKHLKFPFKLIKSIYQSLMILKKEKPDAVVSTGSFVSGPVAAAAFIKGIPVFLQEQNCFPGVTIRLLSKIAKKIFLGFESAKDFLPERKCIHSGNPIQRKTETPPPEFSRLNLRKGSVKLLILGGSQGSVAINDKITEIADRLLDAGIDLIWQVGEKNLPKLDKKLKSRKGIYAFGFTNNLNELYKVADFAIARSGAITVSELEINGIPTIFIPYPHAANNEQYYNAKDFCRQGKGIVLFQNVLDTATLITAIKNMKNSWKAMRQQFQKSIHEDAAELIANNINDYILEKRK